MACDFCSERYDDDGNSLELRGEFAWDEETCLDHRSSGRLSLWHDDEDGWSISILVDNTHEGRRTVNKLPSIVCLPIRYCPLCGRELQ